MLPTVEEVRKMFNFMRSKADQYAAMQYYANLAVKEALKDQVPTLPPPPETPYSSEYNEDYG